MAEKIEARMVNIIERLRLSGRPETYGQVARDLDVPASYLTYWKRNGYIPEARAMDVEALERSDAYGKIDARAVFDAAQAVKVDGVIPRMP